MSWEASGYVKKLKVTPSGQMIARSEKYLALVLADYHNTDTRRAWPKISTLADDCLLKERQVQSLLRRLEKKRVICWFANDTGSHDGSEFHFCAIDGCRKMHPSEKTGAVSQPERVQSGVNSLYIEPTLNDSARATDSTSNYPSTGEGEEVKDVLASLRRARVRGLDEDRVLASWRYFKWLCALCYKARDADARRVLTDKQRKNVYELIVELQAARVDLDRIPRFADFWRQDWHSRGGTMPPTPAQVREFWSEAMNAGSAVGDLAAVENVEPEDRGARLRELRGRKDGEA